MESLDVNCNPVNGCIIPSAGIELPRRASFRVESGQAVADVENSRVLGTVSGGTNYTRVTIHTFYHLWDNNAALEMV
jgi:hypothetical protein